MAATPKNAWGWVKALLHSVYDQPDADAVHGQFDRILDALADKLPGVAHHLDQAGPAFWRSPRSRKRPGGRSGPRTGSLPILRRRSGFRSRTWRRGGG
jgi:hypothetical protein